MIHAVRRLRDAVPPTGVTGAVFWKGQLLLAGEPRRLRGVERQHPHRRATPAIEMRICGESEGLDLIPTLGGSLHWLIAPAPSGCQLTYGPSSALLHFIRRPADERYRVQVTDVDVPRSPARLRPPSGRPSERQPLRDTRVTFAGGAARTDSHGVAIVTTTLEQPGRFSALARNGEKYGLSGLVSVGLSQSAKRAVATRAAGALGAPRAGGPASAVALSDMRLAIVAMVGTQPRWTAGERIRRMTDFLVKRDDLRECRIAESEPPELEPGQALLRVDTFGLTANNVTYAVMGETMSYWDFFPRRSRLGPGADVGLRRGRAKRGRGGRARHARVRISASLLAPGRDARRRQPARLHRRLAAPGAAALGLPPLSGERAPTSSTAPDTEEMQMLLRPLFYTSFLIDDQLDDEGLTSRGPIVISSASSKTAIAAAFLLARRDGVELVALTSPRSAEFVEGLGIYGRTVTYDAIDSLERGPGHLRRRLGRRRGAPSGPLALRRRARPQHGRRASPTGRISAPAARASFPARRRPSSSRRIASSSAPRTGAGPGSRRGSPMPGTRSASGSAAGSSRSAAAASRR